MFVKVLIFFYFGIKGYIVIVEIDMLNGFLSFDIVGFFDVIIKEVKERIRVVIKNSGFDFLIRKIIVNFVFVSIRKEGLFFDLFVVIFVLKLFEQISFKISLQEIVIIGEFFFDGSVKRVDGVLFMIIVVLENGIKKIIVFYENRVECSVVRGIDVFFVKILKEVVEILDDF